MLYHTVVIPSHGDPYIKQTKEYPTDVIDGYEVSCGDISISHPEFRLRALIDATWNELLTFTPCHAEIYAVDEIKRNSFIGLPLKTATQILESLKTRTHFLWDKEPLK